MRSLPWCKRLFAAFGFLMVGCGQDIDSQPRSAAQQVPSARLESAPTAQPEARADTAPAAEAGDRYRTHLYSEHDTDVYSLLDPGASSGSATFVRAIHAELGSRVKTGQVLATLEDTRAALAVEGAQARADEMAARIARTKELADNQAIPRAEYETLLNAQREATADLRRAQLELSRTRVRAPFAGVVSRRYVRVGERVESGTPLFRITALAPLRARVLVPEQRIGAFRPGAAVRVTGADGTRANGRVLLVGPTIDAASGTREVIVQLAGGGAMLPGAEVVAEPAAGAAP